MVEGTCLENKQGESPRGFKSYFLRQILAPRLVCPRRGFLLSRPSFLSIYRCMQQMQMHSVGACATARRACRLLPWRGGAEEPARAPSWRGRGRGSKAPPSATRGESKAPPATSLRCLHKERLSPSPVPTVAPLLRLCIRKRSPGPFAASPYGASAPFVKESWSRKKGLAPPGGRA